MTKLKLFTSTLFLGAMLSGQVTQAVPGITPYQQLQTEAEKRTTLITTPELKKMVDSDPDLVLVDIRLPSEITGMGGRINAPQNINIPRGWLEYRIAAAATSKDTPIVVYCGVGLRSPFAADTLQKMGYTNVKNYKEGYIGWKRAGYPIAR